jgi:uncharacterized DUF497 family protein
MEHLLMSPDHDFEWDETKRLATLKKHGIDFEDAVKVFAASPLIMDSRHLDEDRKIAIGPLHNTLVAVVFTMRGEVTRIITARRARQHERTAYHAHDLERGTRQ